MQCPDKMFHVQALQIPGSVDSSAEAGIFEEHRHGAPGAAGAGQQVPAAEAGGEESQAHRKCEAGEGAEDKKFEVLEEDSSGSGKLIAAEIGNAFISSMAIKSKRKGSWLNTGESNSPATASASMAMAKAGMSGLNAFSSSMPFMADKDAQDTKLFKTQSERKDSLKVIGFRQILPHD